MGLFGSKKIQLSEEQLLQLLAFMKISPSALHYKARSEGGWSYGFVAAQYSVEPMKTQIRIDVTVLWQQFHYNDGTLPVDYRTVPFTATDIRNVNTLKDTAIKERQEFSALIHFAQ
jgi:hypothetical protein